MESTTPLSIYNYCHISLSKRTEHVNHARTDESITLWPGQNDMLKYGVWELISKSDILYFTKRIIFIDFSINNLKLFLTTDWPQNFQGYKMILICDHQMLALANFWYYYPHCLQNIAAVILPTDNIAKAEEKIVTVLTGHQVSPARGMPRLSFTEFIILQLFCQGIKVKEMAYQLNYSIKTIYTYKNRIEKKLKIRIPKN